LQLDGGFSLVILYTGGEEVDGVRKVVMGSRGNNEPVIVESNNGLVLTHHGRWQVVQGLAKPVIRWVLVMVVFVF
jgi:hypothetical protein